MKSQDSTETTILYAITCISQLESGLNYVIKNTSDDNDTKEVLIIIKELAKVKADMLERKLIKITTVAA
ncbi:hypothetical protein [Halodesulfovibrio sp. MK-HDV]|jgi:hypothetical protein|uniref:hypothetical protein n=1 Tax=Halodesulfovibrio sp. MK-HDV TaxID=2599925 RepID=UPI001371C1BC|nr:hypothetical protein [Halodesulfovibrio sp. MK-HDV]KAF1076306.1 hypothetical protein MKHDV_01327 [Halodesulfovibrio sp. MK-HDV]